jgi:hypothetical protein
VGTAHPRLKNYCYAKFDQLAQIRQYVIYTARRGIMDQEKRELEKSLKSIKKQLAQETRKRRAAEESLS